MEHGEIILDLELMDRIDLHDPTAVVRCATRPGSCRPVLPLIPAAPWASPCRRPRRAHERVSHLDWEMCRPLCPRPKPLMSALRKFRNVRLMSALPPKADMT